MHPRRLEQVAASIEADIARLEHRLAGLRVELERPFEDGSKLQALREQRDAIVARLQLADVVESAPLVDEALAQAPSWDLERGVTSIALTGLDHESRR